MPDRSQPPHAPAANGPPPGDDHPDRPAGQAARRLIALHGANAQSVALNRASTGAGAETSARWLEVAAAVGVLSRASLHMELALAMLDDVGEDMASIRLDHAIATLGLRAAARTSASTSAP